MPDFFTMCATIFTAPTATHSGDTSSGGPKSEGIDAEGFRGYLQRQIDAGPRRLSRQWRQWRNPRHDAG